MKEVVGDEQRVYKYLQELYKERKRPALSSELKAGLEDKGISRSKRIIQGVLRSLIDKGLIREKMITEDRVHKGRMGYVPLKETHDISPQKVQKWKLDYLIEVLEDSNLPREVRERASITLKNCCSSRTKIENGGKDTLKQFFSEQLDKPYEDSMYEQVLYALYDFMNFHLRDELGWALQNYGKIQKLFKSDSSVRLRKCALQLLRIVFLRCREEKKKTETLNLAKLFEDTFFDPNEGEKIVSTAFNNLEPIVESNPSFFEKLHKECGSKDKVIRNRCLKYLKDILPTM